MDDFLKIALPMMVLLSPLFASMFSIQSRLAKIEQRLDLDKERIEESLLRHDRHIHEIRNSLQLISLLLAKKGIYENSDHHHND
jgi:hypothetical protein